MSPEQEAFVRDCADQGMNAREAHGALKGSGRWHDFPSMRTLERVLVDMRLADESAPWSVLSVASAEEAQFGLAILAEVVKHSEYRVLSVTQNAMTAAIAVRRGRPDIGPWDAYVLGRSYLIRQRQGQSTEDLDLWLADPVVYQRAQRHVPSLTARSGC